MASSSSKGKQPAIEEPRSKKKRADDIGWLYFERIGDNRQQVIYNFCGKQLKGGGIARGKQHLAGGYPNVAKYEKCPVEISKQVRLHLREKKQENEKIKEIRGEMRENLMSGTRRRAGIREEDIEDTDDEMSIHERRDLQYATNLSIHDIYMAEQGYRQVPHPRMEPTRTRNLSCIQSVKEGRKALSFNRPEAERSLAMYFISSWKEDHLFDVLESGIVNEENMDQLREVAMLAIRCLRMKGEERPSMKELAMELEGIRRTEKHPWVNFDSNQEETEHLLALASNPFNSADTSYITAEYDSLRNHVILSLDDGR
ncbi:Wall-associated receptor kinase-like protein [Quillaja saponaria]|uniref:Wall-associated receptor kinase-like protein n=1 Tax=Quillaja saponaria TaxID=32244 RepID=A0AAD7LWC6_QUISA|nr:Wall-associated receptor kinase-like protein [Quillaja saponaria]